MSAAAGISAAKKRRGVIQTTTELSKQQQQQQQPPVMITPIQILQNHELRLKAVEQQLILAEEAAAETKETVVANAKAKETTVVAQAQPQQPVVSVLPPAQIEEFSKLKTKCESLEKKVDELTNLVNKVQSFSIESNLSLLRLKRLVDEDFENRIHDLKQNYVSTSASNENMFNSVKQDTAAALSSMTATVVSENIHLNVLEQNE
jgi:hypothetical protein